MKHGRREGEIWSVGSVGWAARLRKGSGLATTGSRKGFLSFMVF